VRRNTTTRTLLALTGALGAAAVIAGALTAQAPAEPPAAAPIDHAAEIRAAQTRLADLEDAADAAGLAAQQADEAVLQDDTAENRAAADAARADLVGLAKRQTPELTALATRLEGLGIDTTEEAAGTTATTTALAGRTRALRAVSFAEQQIGDPYGYASAGPGRWDCSGLTMKAYQAVSVGVGGHSATAQWRKAKAQHRLVSFKHKQRGDLIFYGAPGAVYHVAIYAGNGRMIEAPYPGKRVREVPVRTSGMLPNVGRPA
jgi:peptidoglycan DL-endopeptidase CwlO